MPLKPHHAQRELAEEIHSRPQPELSAPCQISLLAVLTGEHGFDAWQEAVADLCARYDAPPPHKARHHSARLGSLEMRFERHTEFVTLTVIRPGESGENPFARTALDYLPADWLATLTGALIAGAHLVFDRADRERDANALELIFEGQPIMASRVMGGVADVYTDWRLHGPPIQGVRAAVDREADPGAVADDDSDKPAAVINGQTFGRFLVRDRGCPPTRAGRLVQRLLDIETYRMTALLSLPLARRTSPEVAMMEQRLADLAGRIDNIGEAETVLHELLDLAAAVEGRLVATSYRFGATAAYHQIILDRLDSLREEKLDDWQRLGEFLAVRFEPAMRYCQSIERRIDGISQRIVRTADLARTRVDVELQRQNQKLLSSMERRALLQLRLQETVEGLSVAAISYYLVGLVFYMLKGAQSLGLPASAVNGLTALAVPVVVIAVWRGLQRFRRRIMDDS